MFIRDKSTSTEEDEDFFSKRNKQPKGDMKWIHVVHLPYQIDVNYVIYIVGAVKIMQPLQTGKC